LRACVYFLGKTPNQEANPSAFNSIDPNRTTKKILLMVDAEECRIVIFKGLIYYN